MTKATSQNHKNVKGVYDLDHSPDYLRLFLDPHMVYSCGYFERNDMSLEEAQIAKFDLTLNKCDLTPGQTLLEVGCGCGGFARRAATEFKANVIGLNPSSEQLQVAQRLADELPADAGTMQLHNCGWEDWNQPVDRIASIGAFEHFGHDNHAAFFEKCRSLLPVDGKLVLHTIVNYELVTLEKRGIELNHEDILFSKFIRDQIFPGGRLISPDSIIKFAADAGLYLDQQHLFGEYYAKTLDTWSANLERNREAALELKGESVYDRFQHYLLGCSRTFRKRIIDLGQFVFRAIE